jgi:type VI secretion system secreted protein VgrG
MTISQDTRIGRLYTPLEDNELVLLDFSGVESVNEINNFTVKALSEKGPIDANKLLGQPMRVELDTRLGTTRYFHQIVFAVRQMGVIGTDAIYEFELRPWIWGMSRRINSRIFHDKSVSDIITEVCAEFATAYSANVDMKLETSLPPLEYVVQYRESDLDFIRRLMEEYGINFHIEMSETSHKMVLTTAISGFADAKGGARVFSQDRQSLTRPEETFSSWAMDRAVPSGKVRYQDYNFETPKVAMEVTETAVKTFDGTTFETMEYPGRYRSTGEARHLIKRRAAALEAAEETIRASGELINLGAGMKFELSEHQDANQKGKYGVLSAHHSFSSNSYRTGAGAGGESYHGTYQLARQNSPVAPTPKTPRPVMRGPQTAEVVQGGDGGEIDKYGRIVVKFHWDKNAISMPCRVSQMWAGPTWGTIFTPHIGMEVVVEFLDGDPDRPLITGCVYNGDNMPPWALPAERLKSGIKTVRNNRLMFDDKESSEVIEVNARKDMNVTVENDETRKVLNDFKSTTFGLSTETVEKDRKVTVKATSLHEITGDMTIKSDASITLQVGSSKIVLKPTSVTIEALQIEISATGSLETKGAKATHKGVGTMILQAPMININ